jgi:hypothetical protein
MSVTTNNSPHRPRVRLVGEHEHPDFNDVVALLRSDAELTFDATTRVCPELIIVARSRPGVMGSRCVEQLRRAAPLAGVVALLGSWCEGQARASRPTHDALRLYWYEFASWWRRQLALYAAGRCPDWARPESLGFQPTSLPTPHSPLHTLIALSTSHWETADVLADVLRRAGYATVWQPAGRSVPVVRGVAVGIWEAGQLDDREAEDLAAFCRRLARDSAPVIALLDFPRRDRCELARQIGAAIVLGKPWINGDLLRSLPATIQNVAPASAA